MFTNKEMLKFGNYLLSEERRSLILNHPDLNDSEKRQRLKIATEEDLKEWFAIHAPKIGKREKDNSIFHNLNRAENGHQLYFEHNGVKLSTKQAVSILNAARKKGYNFIDQIPDAIVEKYL